jgi:hypothetical protein
MWVEIVFNISYLVTIGILILGMLRRQPNVADDDRDLTRPFIGAFALLALGDLGHVGFRVLAYALGGLEATVRLLGREIGLVGLGALSTATTVTFFYVLMLVVWHRRYGKPYGWFGALLFASAVARLILMTFPQNHWGRTVPPWGWSMLRNLPLTVQGLGLAYLILRDAYAREDDAFKTIGWLIIASFSFYLPVILLVQRVPVVGMLMIPKTMAYIAIAWIGYEKLFASSETGSVRHPLSAASRG